MKTFAPVPAVYLLSALLATSSSAAAAPTASATAACPPLPAGVLCQAASVLPEVADGISKFGDAIEHLTALGTEAFRSVTELLDHGRVDRLIRGITQMNVNNDRLIRYLDEYRQYGGQGPTRSWSDVRTQIKETLDLANKIEDQLKELSSRLIEQSAYDEIERAIGAKSDFLRSLDDIPAPSKDDPYFTSLAQSFKNYADAISKCLPIIQHFAERLA
jgi:hypothetical protein